MSYCLNPVCTQPQNSDVTFCQSCGAKLLLRERYRAVRQIGQGGFGKTFLAVDQDLPNKPACVIKQFSPQIQGASGLQKATELFEQEAVQLNILGKHPQIPELLAHFEQDGRLYLVQEYVKGRNLAEELAQDGAFSEAKIRELLVGLLPVLQYIHDNQVIHRDIKPENIIRRDDGKLFVVDFGAVKMVAGSALLGTGTVIGDPRYMPSEQVRGKADFTSDLYALGVTCIHLLTGIETIKLFDDHEDKWIWQDYLKVPIENLLGNCLDKMVERAIRKRFQSAKTILDNLFLNSSKSISNVQIPSKTEHKSTTSQASSITAQLFEPIQMGNKWGYQNQLGQVVTKTFYDEALSFSEGLAPVKLHNKWGYVNEKFDWAVECKYDAAYPFNSGLGRILIDGKYHFINSKGAIAFTPNYTACGDFHEELARVANGIFYPKIKIDSIKYVDTDLSKSSHTTLATEYLNALIREGYIKRFHDEKLILNQFNEMISLNNDKILCGSYGYIDTNGNIVIDCQFNRATNFVNDLAIVGLGTNNLVKKEHGVSCHEFDGKYGVIDKSGRVILRIEFDEISRLENGYFKVQLNKKYGLKDVTGKTLVETKYESVELHKNGYFKISILKQNSNKYFRSTNLFGYIDSSGREIIKPDFEELEDFMLSNLALFRNHQESNSGLINTKGQIVFRCNEIRRFEENLAAFQINDKWGFVNQYGKIVVEAKFLEVGDFKGGVAEVKMKNFFGLKSRKIDKTGRFVN
ncbi:MAG: WG repeat-containing protein [Pseudanabaena sp. M046S1SP1A06QC]|nr:WG repeat-containing protein [Pseudanabaena sp. M046S1SP1A06QC]